MIKLHEDWHHILRRAWSVRLAAVAGLFSAAQIVLPLFDASIPPLLFAGLSGLAAFGAVIARVIVQEDLHVNL